MFLMFYASFQNCAIPERSRMLFICRFQCCSNVCRSTVQLCISFSYKTNYNKKIESTTMRSFNYFPLSSGINFMSLKVGNGINVIMPLTSSQWFYVVGSVVRKRNKTYSQSLLLGAVVRKSYNCISVQHRDRAVEPFFACERKLSK